MPNQYTPNDSPIPATSGIYRIVNTINGKFYLGSSLDLHARWRKHRNDLRCNKHPNKKLQNSWNKHTESAFCFEVVEFALPMCLLEREQYWLDKLKPAFNIALFSQSFHLGLTHSPEARAKMKAARVGQEITAYTRARVRETHLGKVESPETREKKRLALLGHKVSPETRDRISASKTGKTGINLGRVVSPETRARLSAANAGKTNAQNTNRMKTLIVTSPDGTEQFVVHGVYGFCKEHHLNLTNLMNVAKGKHSHHKGWKARFP